MSQRLPQPSRGDSSPQGLVFTNGTTGYGTESSAVWRVSGETSHQAAAVKIWILQPSIPLL